MHKYVDTYYAYNNYYSMYMSHPPSVAMQIRIVRIRRLSVNLSLGFIYASAAVECTVDPDNKNFGRKFDS